MNLDPLIFGRPTRWPIDLAGLGLDPRTNWAVPMPHDLGHPGSWDDDNRIAAHVVGKTTLDTLTDDDQRWLAQRIRDLTAQATERSAKNFAERVPRRYRGADPSTETAEWARAFGHAPEDVSSLLIVGPTGTGKTHLAWGTVKAASVERFSTRWHAYTAADLYAHLRPKTSRDSDAEFDRIAQIELLFVDDLAAAKPTEWNEEITYRLVNHRYEACLPTIFTSNVPPAQLREAIGERIASRLTEMCDRIVLKGADRRKAA